MVLQRQQRSAIDILIAFIAIPLLILCALQLEKNMQASWETDTRWIVFVLGISMLLVSLLICGYVTHRLGMCMWVGPLEDTSPNRQGYSNNNAHVIDVLPPTYDNATKFDILPPTYESVVIQINNLEEKQKMNPIIHI